MKSFMMDIETLGVSEDANVMSVGIVYFDKDSIIDHLYCNVAPQTGRSVDVSTVYWWLEQSKEAQDALTKYRKTATETCRTIRDWVAEVDQNAGCWVKGSRFDHAIMEHLFQSVRVDYPWTFRKQWCMRGLCSMYPKYEPSVNFMVSHNALADATYQAEWVQNVMRRSNGQS